MPFTATANDLSKKTQEQITRAFELHFACLAEKYSNVFSCEITCELSKGGSEWYWCARKPKSLVAVTWIMKDFDLVKYTFAAVAEKIDTELLRLTQQLQLEAAKPPTLWSVLQEGLSDVG